MTIPTPETPRFEKGLLSVLIPVYNERAYLRRCVDKVLQAPLPEGVRMEIVMVDDCSTDGTTDIVRGLGENHPDVIRTFYQDRNQGKGAAIRRAIQEMHGEYAIFQDADLEYDPRDYPAVLQPLVEGLADVVFGSRFASRTMRRVFNYHHALGNMFLTHLSNFTTGLCLTDMETCYKAFRADVLKTIPLRSNRFGIEPEITAKVAKRDCTVYEVPVSYLGRSYAEGKKIGWKDGFSAIYTILRFWLIDDCYEEKYGQAMLTRVTQARRFNRWIVKGVEKYLGHRILEIGSGNGTISRQLPQRESLMVTDGIPAYVQLLHDAFDDNAIVDVAKLDLASDEDFQAVGQQVCDTVLCLNSLEMEENDLGALKRIHSLLQPGGRLVLRVPQHPSFYGSLDETIGYKRRYTAGQLKETLRQAGFEVEQVFSFNRFSSPGWWLVGKVLRSKRMSRAMLKAHDLLVPLLRRVDPILPFPGLSLVCIARRPQD